MKRIVSGLLVSCVAAMALRVSVAADTNVLTSTGLFPVYDASGETHGEDLASFLTLAIYQTLKESGRELVLLNPGGSYSLLDEAASLEYARSAGVHVALVPKFAPTFRTKASDNSPLLQVAVKAVDVATGATLHSFTLGQPVSKKDLEQGFDTGPGFHPFLAIFTKYSAKSRVVEKQALGKTVRAIAEVIRANVLGFNGGSVVYPSAALHQGTFPDSCSVDFAIHYTRQKSASKTYALFVNGRDESTASNNEGIIPLTLKSGLNFFDVSVKDSPYRMPVQKTYTINRWMDCSPEERHLVLEIGGAGDALLVPRP